MDPLHRRKASRLDAIETENGGLSGIPKNESSVSKELSPKEVFPLPPSNPLY